MPSMKKYIVTSVTLGSIAAIAALAIGGVNALTKDIIKANEEAAQQKALQAVFSDAQSFSEKQTEFKIESSKYLVHYYIAYSDTNKQDELGYVYYTSGRNAYGEVAMMIGVDFDGLGQMSIVKNTESYASTLEDNYISKYQENPGMDALEDVKCGATYGAKLIKDMALEASEDYTLQHKGGK